MAATVFADDLARYGPDHASGPAMSVDQAQAYCRRLAQQHYENFTVASWFLPRRLRPHFYHVYAYCRWADDLADETGSPDEATQLLTWWESQLHACYQGQATHPVFIALRETIATFELPSEPFLDLLSAFRQDQIKRRYASRDELLDYCRRSANPVGQLVLRLGRCWNEANAVLSDQICTGLQLANFCQDVARDWNRGRIYLPQDVCQQFGYHEDDFQARRTNRAFRQLLASEVAQAETLLRAGQRLAGQIPRVLATDVSLFAAGGLAILAAIRKIDYDVWATRPTVSRISKARLLVHGLLWPRTEAAR